jgi:hypothetical protein
MNQSATVPNHLIWAILATLFCCLPVGIVGIVFATQVNTKLAAGDIAGAQDSSAKAKMWTMIAAGIGLLGWLLWVCYFVFVMMAVGASGAY